MRIGFLWASLAVLFFAAAARADDATRATQLFNEGRDLLKRGAHAEACARFRDSFALHARPGTLMNIASCEEADGHLVRAHEHWSKAAAAARALGDARAPYAEEQDAAVIRRTPHLTVILGVNAPVTARALVDGEALPVGTAAPIDPGEHVVAVTAPGRADEERKVTLFEGEERTVTVELVTPIAAPPAVPAPHLESAPAELVPEPPRSTARASWSWMKPSGYGVGAVGIGGLAAGAILAIVAVQKKAQSDEEGCAGKVCTNEPAYELRGESANAAGWASAAFIAGGIATAGGVALILFAPRSSTSKTVSSEVRVVVQLGGASLSGTF